MMNNWSALTIGLVIGSVATRYFYGHQKKTDKVKKSMNVPFETWNTCDKTELFIKIVKIPLKIVSKSIKAWKELPTQQLKTRSSINYLIGPNALTVYPLLVGVGVIAYSTIKGETNNPAPNLTNKMISVLLPTMEAYRNTMYVYNFVKFGTTLLRNPSKYLLPTILASTMVCLSVCRNKL